MLQRGQLQCMRSSDCNLTRRPPETWRDVLPVRLLPPEIGQPRKRSLLNISFSEGGHARVLDGTAPDRSGWYLKEFFKFAWPRPAGNV